MAERKRMSMDQMTHARDHMEDRGQRRPEVVDLSSIRGVKYFSPKEGPNTINIVPFVIATNNHPMVRAKKASIGDLSWSLDIWVHQKIGEGEESVLCNKKTYGGKCPICDRVGELYDAAGPKGAQDKGSYAMAGALKASRRTYLNVQSFIKGEAQELAVYHASHFLFTQELIAESTACEDGTEIINFADPVDGTLVKFRAEEMEDFKGAFECKSFKFPDRQEELEEGLEDKAIPFDKYLKVLTSEQVTAIMYGGPVAEAEDEDSPAPTPAKTKAPPVEEEDEDSPRPPKRSRLAPVPDPEPETPAQKPTRKAAPAAEVSKSTPKAETAQADPRCPSGHGFGLSCYGSFTECKGCPKGDDCMMED